tara:strand:- start:809 stop:1006 length:198 start_codon:yes stop_codon:yes gene_type:complete
MHPRERVLGVALLHKSKGENIPVDVLAEMDQYGISLSDFIDLPDLSVEQPLITEENEMENYYEKQ